MGIEAHHADVVRGCVRVPRHLTARPAIWTRYHTDRPLPAAGECRSGASHTGANSGAAAGVGGARLLCAFFFR